MWKPQIPTMRPIYRGIISALQLDISERRLLPGERLPTQRKLAENLGVTVGTVTKAFTEAERTGLIVSRVGRGSFVLRFPEDAIAPETSADTVIDLSVNTVAIEPLNNALNRVLGALSRRKSLYRLLEHHPIPGLLHQRAAGAKWLKLRGIDAGAEQMIVCNGSQEGLMAALATVTRPGDVVLTEHLNYAGIRRLADLFRLDIRGVSMDEHGIRPDRLMDIGKDRRVGAILCSPTLHNPTNTTMPIERRRELLAVAARLGAVVIEDDCYGHLSADETPTLTALDPTRCIYLCGTSKSIAPGLRIGYMRGPDPLFARLSDGVHASSWTSPSLMGEVAATLIEEGMAATFLAWHRREAAARLEIARRILGPMIAVPSGPTYHIWHHLAEPWRATEFAAELRMGGVLVSPADFFATDRAPPPHAIRISLGAVPDRTMLEKGLQIIGDALQRRPSTTRSAV